VVSIATPIRPLTQQTVSNSASGGVQGALDFVWGNITIIVVVIGVIFGIIVLIYLWKAKKKYDPYLIDFERKRNQCKMHSWSGIEDFYIENDRQGLVPMGTYEGECIDKEGFHDILFSRKKWGKVGGFLYKVLFFARPILDLIIKKFWIVRCNTVKSMIVSETVTLKGKKRTFNKKKFLAVPLITRGNKSMILHADGLQIKKYFTYPILKDVEGFTINDEVHNFKRERDTVITDTLYDQTVEFSNAMREAINMNPSLRYVVKTDGKTLPDTSGGQ